jgi:PAS domain S-box-containing protein
MAAAFSRTPRIVLRFAVYAGVAVVLAAGLGLWIARNDAVGRARDEVRADAKFVADRLGRDDLARRAFLWPRPNDADSRTAQLDDFLDPKNAAHDIVGLTLVSPDGWVTYSTNHRMVGRHLGRIPEGARVTGSGAHRVLEAYVPVYWVMDPSRPRGYLGIERNYAPVAAQIQRTFALQAGSTALALLVLYLALLPIMHRLTAGLKRALAERQRLAAIVETSNDAIVGLDRDGLVTSWNAGAEHVYGWNAGAVIGRPLDFLQKDGEVPDAADAELTRTLHQRKDGVPVLVSITISPIRSDKGELVGSSVIARDVTDLAELERELREAQRQEVVGRFATAMANELDELVAGLVPTDAGARGLELVKRLREFGKVEEAHPETLDLNEMLSGLRLRIQLQLGDGIELVLDPASARSTVTADPQRLERVVIDLALSARDAMDEGGRLAIRTEDIDFSRRSGARGATLEAGHYVMLSVSDSGGSPHAERMGLGLATVFGLVEQSGGTIGIESRPGEGTTVRVYLPRAEPTSVERVA